MARAQVLTDGDGRCYRIQFHCPGCNDEHGVRVTTPPAGYELREPSPPHPCWTWNGNLDLPTFSPSVLVTRGHFCHNPPVPGNCACDFQERFPDEEPWAWPCTRCHSFVRDGRIQFLPDSTHKLAGQTVDLPEIAAA